MLGFEFFRKLQLSLYSTNGHGILAALAYISKHLVQRLCLYTLGGKPQGLKRQFFNIFIVWALTGLWHGASWNFRLWGYIMRFADDRKGFFA
jgi:hypothetical protein